jgi:hypothetical protein
MLRNWNYASRSRIAQAVWFRLLKWAIAIGVSAVLRPTPYFWWWIVAAIVLSLGVHFIWRWKTKGWTRARGGGWNDVQAADND